ncbi:intraflagellar transport protein 122-like protein, partial [Leptotrombidium deliense]
MRTTLLWSEKLEDREGNVSSVYDLALSPDGSHLIVAASNRVYVYNGKDFTIIQALKGHKENVLCVAYAKDGKRFASGSADRQVIIWTAKLEGILKYSHNDIIKCMAYNPVTHQLASCTASDVGLWSVEQKSVTKHKLPGQVNACAWSNDGHNLALALSIGYISIRNRTGEEKMKVERIGTPLQHISGVSFCTIKDSDCELLAVVDWSQNLSFYDMSGKQVGKEKFLGFDPLCISHFDNSEYMLISGTHNQAMLYTKEGVAIGTICEQNSWAVGTHDGEIKVFELVFSTVHSLYKERYAYRENMTDVIIQHLITEEKVRIKCRDLVKKIAIYKNRLAIQLPERVVIYEVSKDEQQVDMHYKVKEKVNQRIECTLLVVCSESIVLCQEKRLQCLSFQGNLEREWTMDSAIRYIKAVGGPSGKEGLLVGLKNGQIVQIYLNNPFPINIVKISNPVRCLDLSLLRQKLAAVDDRGNCYVYDMKTRQLLYQESNANSVAWNNQFEDMLCFSGAGTLSIKASNFPTHTQQLQGFVVGFCGSKVFCLHYNVVTTIEVSQSVPLLQYLEKKQFREAYKTACLNVTEQDWNQLAHAALEAMELWIARKAFTRLKNYAYLDLIQSFALSGVVHNKSSEISFLGDIMAYKSCFTEAAKLYKQAGHDDKAVTMYSDLRMFDEAQELIRSGDVQFKKELAVKRADWIHNINEPRAAAEMYLAAGDTTKAIEIIGKHAWID